MPALPGLHQTGKVPLTGGQQGLELVRILESIHRVLEKRRGPIELDHQQNGATVLRPAAIAPTQPPAPLRNANPRREVPAAGLVENLT